eukprot:358585-Chlamydomonas_euryale.AAC.2
MLCAWQWPGTRRGARFLLTIQGFLSMWPGSGLLAQPRGLPRQLIRGSVVLWLRLAGWAILVL